jgi:hypothetical protein
LQFSPAALQFAMLLLLLQVPLQVPEQDVLLAAAPMLHVLPDSQVPPVLELQVPLKLVFVTVHVALLVAVGTQRVPDAQAPLALLAQLPLQFSPVVVQLTPLLLLQVPVQVPEQDPELALPVVQVLPDWQRPLLVASHSPLKPECARLQAAVLVVDGAHK